MGHPTAPRIQRRLGHLPFEPDRQKQGDWLDKLADTLEETDECDHWLSVIEENKVNAVPQELRSETRQLRSIISKSLATGRANERKKKRRRKD